MQGRALERVVAVPVPQVRDESAVLSNADVSAIESWDPDYELSKKFHEMGVFDEIQMFEYGCRQWRLGETRGVRREMADEVVRFVPRERISDGIEEQIVFLNGRWVTVTGGDDAYIKKFIASGGLYSPEESGHRDDVVSARRTRARELADVLQPILELLESCSRLSVEDGNVKGGYMRSWKGELRDSGSGPEEDTRARDEAGGGDGGSKSIYVRQGEKVRQASREELMKWAEDGSDDAYPVHDGKIVTSRMINRLEDCAMIRLVNRLLGGGRQKKVAPEEQGR